MGHRGRGVADWRRCVERDEPRSRMSPARAARAKNDATRGPGERGVEADRRWSGAISGSSEVRRDYGWIVRAPVRTVVPTRRSQSRAFLLPPFGAVMEALIVSDVTVMT
jgi:hypothetical protein